MNQVRLTLAALMDVIARSAIVLRRSPKPLPAGYGDVDAAVLAWIAAEGCRISRRYTLM